ncbi:MAG: hypothetical protein QM770_04990 [Tepidisphaeraceae bacterium]
MVFGADGLLEASSNGRELRVSVGPLPAQPAMWTSSSLGDALVDLPRRALFESMVIGSPCSQDAFHDHTWAEAADVSVCMRRDDAQTVSRTVIERDSHCVTLRYRATGDVDEHAQSLWLPAVVGALPEVHIG